MGIIQYNHFLCPTPCSSVPSPCNSV